MNNDNKVETAMAGLDCWASYATDQVSFQRVDTPVTSHIEF